jgi:hypothetical protein
VNIEETKQKLVEKIQSITDPKELGRIQAAIYEEDIETLVSILLKSRGYPLSTPLVKSLLPMIVNARGTFDEKMSFLHDAIVQGFLDGTRILESGIKRNFKNLFTHHHELLDDLMVDLIRWIHQDMSKTKVGEGEAFIALGLSGSSVVGDEGDVLISGAPYEVKATKSRTGDTGGAMKGQGEAWGSTINCHHTFMNNLAGLTELPLNTADPNAYNFHKTGFENMSTLFVKSKKVTEKRQVVTFFEYMIKMVFIKAYKSELSWINKCIYKDCSINWQEFRKEFMLFQFAYYQRISQFRAVIFVNVYSFNYMVIENVDQLRENLAHFNISMSFGWKEVQGNVYKLGLRG